MHYILRLQVKSLASSPYWICEKYIDIYIYIDSLHKIKLEVLSTQIIVIKMHNFLHKKALPNRLDMGFL